ncbi:hypothetical protein M430DRAFT_93396, partial [Amorphotheca resinae ATCC 22711]
ELKVLKEYIIKLERIGFIQQSTLEAGAPIMFVKKKDGSLRPCIERCQIDI